ncbi:MAG TPA: hypothetical protein VFB15_02690 [Candidatus Binataceae bacterium]|nr:hypothetical protein [Candidatus Binataceae bacterium]
MDAALQTREPPGPPPIYRSAGRRLPEVSGVFHGRELTRKERRLACGIEVIDRLLAGGILRGRLSELVGAVSGGKTSLAMAFAAQATQREAAAWIETGNSLDPLSLTASGINPARMLWVACPAPSHGRTLPALKVAEWLLGVGGFGLVVLDLAGEQRLLPIGVSLRIARAAEASGAAVMVLAERRVCGAPAALTLSLTGRQARFSRSAPQAPALFDGIEVELTVRHNKLGGVGAGVRWSAVTAWDSRSGRARRSAAAAEPRPLAVDAG